MNGRSGAATATPKGEIETALAASTRGGSDPAPENEVLPASRRELFASFQSDAPLCDNCGAITVRNGNCHLCHNCGNSLGCS
jgi:ribonucleoside-diphosphate reductase alpha chain